jgi:hypothetical protein
MYGDCKKLKDYRLLQDEFKKKEGAYFASQLCELPFQ